MRRLVVALAILAIAVAGAMFYLRQQKRAASEERAAATLLAFDSRAAGRLTITDEDGEWEFERGPDGWRMVAPVDDYADGNAIDLVLVALQRTPVLETIEQPEALTSYGLDPPQKVFGVELSGGERVQLQLGATTVAGDSCFAVAEGRPGVLVISLGDLNRAKPYHMRVLSPVTFPRTEIDGIRLNDLRLAREGDIWWIVEPFRLPASQAKVERLLTAVEENRVRRFLDGADRSDPRYGLTTPQFVMELSTRDRALTLRFGAVENGERCVASDDRESLLVVEDEPLATMPRTLRDLAGDRLTGINRYAVTGLDCGAGAPEYTLARDAEGVWTDGAGVTVDEGVAYARIAEVLEARVADWKTSGRGAAARSTCVAQLEDGGREEVAFLGGRRARVASLPGVEFELESEAAPLRAQ